MPVCGGFRRFEGLVFRGGLGLTGFMVVGGVVVLGEGKGRWGWFGYLVV